MVTDSDLIVGNIFEIYGDDQSWPPKSKMCIIVGISSDKSEFGTVFINTGINMNFINSPELEELQIPFNPNSERPFLKHNSYIDCAHIKQRFPDSFIRTVKEGGKLIGKLSPQDLRRMLDLMQEKGSEAISPYFLKLYNIL